MGERQAEDQDYGKQWNVDFMRADGSERAPGNWTVFGECHREAEADFLRAEWDRQYAEFPSEDDRVGEDSEWVV
jgi:hypothetical protein